MLYPPTRTCLECTRKSATSDGAIQARELDAPVMHAITVFSAELGAIPGYATSSYCRCTYPYLYFIKY